MIEIADLPAINAMLNGLSAGLLATGYVLIRRGRVTPHKACMLAAFGASVLFLISYLIYHAHVGSKPFLGEGFIRIVYFTVLISHVVLAVTIFPLALVTISRALRARFDRHVALARWTLPIWLYVSVTGLIVYFMLYQLQL